MKHRRVAFYLFTVLVVSLAVTSGCPPAVRVTIRTQVSNVPVGGSLQLHATSTDASDTQFTWVSHNLRMATVDETGMVAGLGLGQVLITATGNHSGRTATAQIRVVAGDGFNLSLPADPRSVAPAQTIESALDACTCTLQLPGIAAEIRDEHAVLYQRLKLPGAGSTEEVGRPEIPFYTLCFAVPRDIQTGEPAAWEATVTAASEKILNGIHAYPAQPPSWLEGDLPEQKAKASGAPEGERPPFTIDEEFYKTSGPYPQSRMRLSEFDAGNLRVAEVRVFPALYYPQARQVRLSQRLTVEVRFASQNGLEDPVIVGDFTGRQEPGGEEWLADFTMNTERLHIFTAGDLPAALAPLDRTTLQDEFFELLIVTRPSLYSEAFQYGLWKQDQGLRVFLASLSEEAYPDAESIREYIRAIDADNRLLAIDRLGPHAMWALCLFGDAEMIPPCAGMNYRGCAVPAAGEPPVSIVGTDSLYGAVRGADEIPDFAVGRISVNGAIEADNVLSKIRNYESHADSPHHMAMYSYFADVIWPLYYLDGVAAFTAGSASVHGAGTHFTTQISTADFVDYLGIADGDTWYGWYDVATVVSDTELVLAAPFNGPHDMSGPVALGGQDGQDDWEFVKAAERVRGFMVDRGVTARFGYTRDAGPAPVRGFEGAPLAADLLGYAWDVTTANIKANWREGLDGIVLHSDHGERHGWQEPPYFRVDIVRLTDAENGFYPIVFSVNCDSGWFDNETDTRIWGVADIRPDLRTPLGDESFCERVVRFANGGAVAAIGACRGSEACHNDKLIDGLFAGMYDDYVRGSVLERRRPASCRLGPALQWAKLHQHRLVDNATYDQYNMQIWHLFGDPALRLNVPQP